MTWNNPSNVSTGDNLTATLWNNQLGANGSLQYLYNLNKSLFIQRTVSTSVSANSTYTISWDNVFLNNGFTISVPTTSITPPTTGLYAYSFAFATSASTQFIFRIVRTADSATNWNYIASSPSTAVGAHTFSGISYLIGGSSGAFTTPVSITTATTLSAFMTLTLVKID